MALSEFERNAMVEQVVTAATIAQYMPLVRGVVASFLARVPPNVLRDDLLAAGAVGLLDALRRQRGGERGGEFNWYLRVRIRGAIVDELRAEDWLSRRARRHFASAARSASGAVVGIEDLPVDQREIEDVAASPEMQTCAKGEAAALMRAVARLPVRERGIITAHYVEGVQFRVIAAGLGVSEARVSQLHSRAVGRLRGYLTEASVGDVS
jgi:RNA polymerase sigma factor for flagellar operon FliA